MISSKDLREHTKSLSLLFVEDHEALRINTTDVLQNFFNCVDSAANGEEALILYNKNSYDIVITDILMPKMDGVELTEKIYEIKPDQTIVVLSSYDESQYLLPLINLGIDQFIKKPIEHQALLKVLLNVVQKSSVNSLTTSNVELGENIFYNRNTQSLSHNNEGIYLTKFEIIFLQELTAKVEKIYSNEDIVSQFESLDESIDAQNIRKLVSKLRKKLPENSLESIYGVGYRIISNYLKTAI